MCNKISKRFYFETLRFIIFLTVFFTVYDAFSQPIVGYRQISRYKEQEQTISDSTTKMTVCINAPLHFKNNGKTFLILYALPNGNSIEWTKGKKINKNDDWHFDIQHIAAQLRFIRVKDKTNNYIIAYLMTEQKSWPAWKRSQPGSLQLIKELVDSLHSLFVHYQPAIILSGHSGGGSFIFGYIDAVEEIPANVERISFMDSDYGYTDSLHTNKLVSWLKQGRSHNLVVLAYNDSLVIYNGKPLVSPTGGTWYRSRWMQRNLSKFFHFNTTKDTAFIRHKALQGRIIIILKQNPHGLIYHTVQVEKNGFIYSIFSNTRFDKKRYFSYFGKRAYEKRIDDGG